MLEMYSRHARRAERREEGVGRPRLFGLAASQPCCTRHSPHRSIVPSTRLPMVSTDRASKTVLLASLGPAVVIAALLLWQWRCSACTFREAVPGQGLYLCRQRLAGFDVQLPLVRVQRREGWLWGRRLVSRRAAVVGWAEEARTGMGLSSTAHIE